MVHTLCVTYTSPQLCAGVRFPTFSRSRFCLLQKGATKGVGKLLPFPVNFVFLIYVSSAQLKTSHVKIYCCKQAKCNAKINQGRKYSPWKNFSLCESHFKRCTVLPTDNLLQLLRITQAAVSFQKPTYSSPRQLQQGISWEKTQVFLHLAVVWSIELIVFPHGNIANIFFFKVLFNFLITYYLRFASFLLLVRA